LLCLPRVFVLCRDVQYPTCVNVKSDFNLRHSSGGRTYTLEANISQAAVVARQFAFALQHVDIDCCLIILSGGEELRLASGYGRVALDQFRHDAAKCLQPEG